MDKRGKKLVTSISPSASDQSYKPLLEFVLPKMWAVKDQCF